MSDERDPANRDVPAEAAAESSAVGLTESATPDALLYNEPVINDPNVNPSIAAAAAEDEGATAFGRAEGEVTRGGDDDEYDPGNDSVENVLAYVDQNPEAASRVLSAEKSGKNRSTLISQLEAR